MYRCASTLVAFAAATACVSVQAQVHRQFPAYALRGELVVQQTPDAVLNGHAAKLAPGARVRGDNNLLITPASIAGQKVTVHYTVEATSGMLLDVWVLNAAELANKTWPRTAQEAASWAFDAGTQTWLKR